VNIYISPVNIWWVSLFGLAFPYIAILNLLFIIYWIIAGKRQFLLSLIFILVGWRQITGYVQLNRICEPDLESSKFEIFCFNTHNLSDNNVGVLDKEARQKIFTYIKNESPEIICLQEFFTTSNEREQILKDFSSLIGKTHYYSDVYFDSDKNNTNSLVILSTFPIIDHGTIRFTNKKAISIFTDFVFNVNDTIRLYNVHLQSVHLIQKDLEFVKDITSQPNSNDFKSGSKRILWKLRQAFTNRASQVMILKEHIQNSPYPVIVCGDFNDTPSSFAYHHMLKGLKDSFKESGTGFAFTFAGNLPVPLRLDYILYDKFFASCNFDTHKVDLSDHYPISVTLIVDPLIENQNTDGIRTDL